MKSINKSNLFVLTLIALMTLSCADSGSGTDKLAPTTNTHFSSRIPVPDNGKNKPDNVAVCNATEMKFLTAKSMVYYDKANQPRYNAIRVWLPNMSADFEDSRYHINFYKWKADLQGEIYFDKTPLQIRIEKKSNKLNVSGYLDSLNWGKIKDTLTTSNIDTSDMDTIFNDYSFTILLDKAQTSSTAIPYELDQSVDYDVLKIAVYKDSNLVEEKDFLLPAFYAHPQTFSDGKSDVLLKLHPHYKDLNSSWPGAHFAELSNANCF